MSLSLLVFCAGVAAGFLAARAAARRQRELRLALYRPYLERARRRLAAAAESAGETAEANPFASGAGLDAELRRARGAPAPSLYTREQLEAARRALRPAFGITMRVKP